MCSCAELNNVVGLEQKDHNDFTALTNKKGEVLCCFESYIRVSVHVFMHIRACACV